MIENIDAIRALVPDAGMVYSEGMVTQWLDDRPQPTDEEIAAKKLELQAEYDAKQYQRNRAVAYPAIGDQLDMLFHAIDEDETLKTQFADFHTALKAVKDQYPKG